MAIPQSQATLKSYFETGDMPSQAQFAELIDTMFYLYNEVVASSAAAASDAADALDAVNNYGPKVLAKFTSNGATVTLTAGSLNVASVTKVAGSGVGPFTYRITFTTAFASGAYKTLTSGGCSMTAQTTTYVDVVVALSSSAAPQGIACFP